MSECYTNKKLEELTDKWMPKEGYSEHVLGNILIAINRIGYKYYNDDDQLGRLSGKDIVNAMARYLVTKIEDYHVVDAIERLSTSYNYDKDLNYLIDVVTDYIVCNFDELLNTKDNLKSWGDYRLINDDKYPPEDFDFEDLFDEDDLQWYIDELNEYKIYCDLELFYFCDYDSAEDLKIYLEYLKK